MQSIHLFYVLWHRDNPWTVKSAPLACFILMGVASEIRTGQASFLTAELKKKARKKENRKKGRRLQMELYLSDLVTGEYSHS